MATNFLITDAGLAALVNAQQNGTLPLVFETVQFGSGKYTPTAAQTQLQTPFKTLSTIAGGAVGDNVIHIQISDVSADQYDVYEVGVFTDDNVLFAVYSQDTPIISKAANSQALLAIDFVVANASEDDIEVSGGTNFVNPPATTETAGVVKLATVSDAKAGLDSSKAVTPAGLGEALKEAGSKLNDKSIPTSKLADGSVTEAKLAANAVSTAKIADGSVTEAKLGAGAVGYAKLKSSDIATKQDLESGTDNKIVSAAVLKQRLDDLSEILCPRGTCQCFLRKEAPEGWLIMDGSQVDHEDAPELVELLWQFDLTKGDSSTYAVLPNMNGRVFQGTTTVADVCKYLEAQLPNITGWLYDVHAGAGATATQVATWSKSGNRQGAALSGDWQYGGFGFNASRCSSTYTGSKLQAPALQVLPCIRA